MPSAGCCWAPTTSIPRTTNKILRAYLKSKGVKDSDIDEKSHAVRPFDYQTIVADIKKFSQGGKTAVVSTINGDSNVPFYKELGNAGLKAKDVPVVAFSVARKNCAAWTPSRWWATWRHGTTSCRSRTPPTPPSSSGATTPAPRKFRATWTSPLTNDPMEATWIGIHMWKQAVEKAKSTDVDKVIAAMAGQTFKAPSGIVSTMDEKTTTCTKSVFIGEIKADGQFNVVWKTPGPVKAVTTGRPSSKAMTRKKTNPR